MTTYWKFLRPDRLSPLARHPWPAPGQWLDTAGVVPCRQGVHACRVDDLPYWIFDELWEIELDGPVTQLPTKVVAPRGRLVARVDAWNPATADEFGLACLLRIGTHAVAELRAGGLDQPAAQLEQVLAADPTPERLGQHGQAATQAAQAAGHRAAEWISGFLVYGVDVLAADPVASIAYIATRAASLRTAADRVDERAWQAAWLGTRLGLTGREKSWRSLLRRRA